MSLTVSSCTWVVSVEPVGDESLYLEPREWEGVWVSDMWSDSGGVETFTVRIVDAVSGVLERRHLQDSTTHQFFVRQNAYGNDKDKHAFFISVLNEDDDPAGYSWAMFQRNGNALIPFLPDFDEFKTLVEKGEINGTLESEYVVRLEHLPKDQLDRISANVEHKLFDYEQPSFPVFYRISPVPSDGGKRCSTSSGQTGLTKVSNLRYTVSTSYPFKFDDYHEYLERRSLYRHSATESGTLGTSDILNSSAGWLSRIGSRASAINIKGEVVGTSKTVEGYTRAYKWHPSTGTIELCTLGGIDSAAYAINSTSQVVGWSEIRWADRERHAFLWDKGTMLDLNSLPEVEAAGWSKLIEATGINDQGAIVGLGVREDGGIHVFLLTPEPLPAASVNKDNE